jgi:hypothetical protein
VCLWNAGYCSFILVLNEPSAAASRNGLIQVYSEENVFRLDYFSVYKVSVLHFLFFYKHSLEIQDFKSRALWGRSWLTFDTSSTPAGHFRIGDETLDNHADIPYGVTKLEDGYHVIAFRIFRVADEC